jgi:hypothetical protein
MKSGNESELMSYSPGHVERDTTVVWLTPKGLCEEFNGAATTAPTRAQR